MIESEEFFPIFSLVLPNLVYTIEQTKVKLSNFDDKRFILNDGYSTLAHGHYRIRGDIR